MTRKCLLTIFSILLLFVFEFSAHAEDNQQANKYVAPQEISLGVILPLSGDAALWGEATRNGITLAIESLEPQVKEKVKVYYEDDMMEPKNTISAFKRLVAQRKINRLILWSSGTSKSVAHLAEAQHIPTMAIASDQTICRNRKYVKCIWVTPEVEVNAIVKEATKRGYKNIISIYTIQEAALAVKDAFNKAKGDKLNNAYNEEVPQSEKDFRSIITKMLQVKDASAIFAVLMPGQVGLFARQVRELGIKLPIFGVETFENQEELKVAQGALEGGWFATSADADNQFTVIYKERFPKSTLITAPQAYDALKLLVQPLNSNSESMDSQIDFLNNLKDYPGASGIFSANGQGGFSLPASLKEIQGQEFVVLK